MAYTDAQQQSGESYAAIADELGFAFETIRRWCVSAESLRSPRASSVFVPVEVVAPSRRVAVVSPNGLRLEGLDIAIALGRARALA